LNLVGMNDDAPGRTTSRLTVSITQGTTYHIAVSGKNGASGFILLALGIPPPNDNFAAAEVLTGVSAQTVGLITNASSESGEPVLPDIATAQGTTVWYRWVAPRRSHFTVAVGTDSFAPVIGIYEGDTLGSLTLVASREGAAWFEARAGRTYHFKVDSSSLRAGAFILSLLEADGAIRLGYSMHASVAFSRHGALVSVSDRGVVVQIAPDGESWVLPVKGEVDVATPAVAADGSVYVTTSRGLFAISKLGQLKWEKLVDEGFSGSPAVASDGTVLAHSDDGWLHAYTPAGKRRWRVRVPGISYASPVVAPNGTIYLGSDDGHVYAISAADGAQRWRLDTGGAVYSSVAIGGDGTLYVGNLGGRFVAINPDGTEKWRHQVGTAISSSACIGPDGTLYFGARDGKLYALRADGTLRWTYGTGDEIRGSSPAIDSGGTVYIGSYDLRLHAVNANGTLKQTYPTGGIIRSSPMVDDEFLLFGSGDGNVYFIYTGAVLAPTPWPMHRQNPERTGRRHSTSSPTIHTQPRSRTIATGGSATLSVNADGEDPMSFQ
jgi:outer membrane protein assembly factor BamB